MDKFQNYTTRGLRIHVTIPKRKGEKKRYYVIVNGNKKYVRDPHKKHVRLIDKDKAKKTKKKT